MFCKCGYKEKFDEKRIETKKMESNIEKNYELEENLIIISKKEKILIYPKVQKTCPKCGHNEAVYWQEQILSADEPSTSFFRCLKCNKVWREY